MLEAVLALSEAVSGEADTEPTEVRAHEWNPLEEPVAERARPRRLASQRIGASRRLRAARRRPAASAPLKLIVAGKRVRRPAEKEPWRLGRGG